MFSHTAQKLDQDTWHQILDQFQDASVLQTIAFCAASSPSSEVEHFILHRGSELVAAAQVRIIQAPLFCSGLAYVLWGPLWHRHESSRDIGILRHAVKLLRQEYVVRRRMSLRVNPRLTVDDGSEYFALFIEEGYSQRTVTKGPRTILIGLDKSIDELRKGLDGKWRNCLNRSEKNNLKLVEGYSDSLFDMFMPAYRQMLARKQLAEPGNIRVFRAMQQMLPNQHKMKVIVAFENNEISAGAICSAVGGTGVYLFGATANIGLKNKAAYLVQWRVIEWLKESNCIAYDLHGVNARSNPGVYAFKIGLCGKNGKEVEFSGSFEAHRGARQKLLWKFADVMKDQRNRLKYLYAKFRGFTG
jgi:FemAB family